MKEKRYSLSDIIRWSHARYEVFSMCLEAQAWFFLLGETPQKYVQSYEDAQTREIVFQYE